VAELGELELTIAQLSDDQLLDAFISLALACGRSKNALSSKRRTSFCFLLRVLGAELSKRGVGHPSKHTRDDKDLLAV
jgi:hypothetical protein